MHARPRRAPIRAAAVFVLCLLALVGLVAIVLLILGLGHVHGVTEHFRVH